MRERDRMDTEDLRGLLYIKGVRPETARMMDGVDYQITFSYLIGHRLEALTVHFRSKADRRDWFAAYKGGWEITQKRMQEAKEAAENA